jgi:hypothetical protein
MGKFNYMKYDKLDGLLYEYFESIGYDDEKVWDIHFELTCYYTDMCNNKKLDEESVIKTINKFVRHCKKIKDAYLYPISVQETLQRLILIAYYSSLEYENIKTAAYNAAHIFHTTINHPGE